MTALSLCSGFGGLDLAVEAVLDVETSAWCETDPHASTVFARHWPDAEPLGDLTAVDWARHAGRFDVLSAGFPCQDLSYAGRGEGIREGNRSGLWHAIADALGHLRPRFVVLENVSAIVGRRPGLDVVLAGLADLGLDARWTCVRASDVGAPHRRERWFAAAYPAGRDVEEFAAVDGGQPAVVGSELGAGGRAGGGRSAAGVPVVGRGAGPQRQAFADAGGGELQRRRGLGVVGGAPGADAGPSRQRERDGDTAGGSGTAAADADGRGRQERPQLDGEPQQAAADWDTRGGHADRRDQQTPADTEGVGRSEGGAGADGRRATADRAPAWGDYGPAVARWEQRLGRPAPAPVDDRGRLSPRFVEWMMGLTEGWVTGTEGLSRSAQLRVLGNGVVPQQAELALRWLLSSAALGGVA